MPVDAIKTILITRLPSKIKLAGKRTLYLKWIA
jgi:hypothetical protein